MNRATLIPVFCGFAMCVPVVSHAADAWLRVNASMCVRNVPGTSYAAGGAEPWDYVGGQSDALGTTQSDEDAICAYHDQNELQRDDLEEFNVYLNDTSSNAEGFVELCRRSFTSSAATCGPASGTGVAFTGDKTLGISSGLDDSAWTTTSGAAYVYLDGRSFRFRGYYAENQITATPIESFNGQAALCSIEDSDQMHTNIFYPWSTFEDGVFLAGETQSGGSAGDLICSYPERNGIQRDDLTRLVFYAWDESETDDVEVQLCRRSYTSSGSACGMVAVGDDEDGEDPDVRFTIGQLGNLDDSEWATTSGTAYVHVHLPGPDGQGNQSELRGFYLENI